uniref:Uncharacterized protein n=1 Tax=viral metagenome TaxID=1070528 RepID=A0A6M3LLR0_9ZZZZ
MEDTTAVVTIQISPANDDKYLALKTEVEGLCRSIEGMTVDSHSAVARITEDVNLAQKTGNQIEKLRKAYKDPLVQYGKQIDAAFKPLSEPIENARQVASKKIVGYNNIQRAEQARIADENARKAREAAELQQMINEENERIRQQQKVDTETGEITGPELIAPEPEPEYVAPPPVVQKATTELGSATEKMVPKFRLVDITKVPASHLLLNERTVKAVLSGGVREIPGLEIWEEADISFRAK